MVKLIRSRGADSRTVAGDILKHAGEYFGKMRAEDADGVVDVEFPNVFEAACFVHTLEVGDLSTFRDPPADFLAPVVVQIRTVEGEEETDNAGAHA